MTRSATLFLTLVAACRPGDEPELFLDTARPSLELPEPSRAALARGEPAVLLVEYDDRDIDALVRSDPYDRPGWIAARAEVREVVREDLLDTFPSGVEVVRAYAHMPLVAVRVHSFADADALVSHPDLVRLDPEQAYEAALTQSLPLIGQPATAAAGRTGAGTSVAVLDTGANYAVADLGSCTAVGVPATCRVAYAQDFAPSDGVLDSGGHGTNVSAIVASVAPGTDILALDVFNGASAWSTDIIAAIDWVIANQALYDIAAINMSLGAGSYASPCVDAFSTAITNAKAAGVAVVVASGNNAYTSSIASPACNSAAFSVGAVYDSAMGGIGWSACSDSTTAADKVTCFSNSASFLDILAPGALIVAGTYTMGGTSQASPHVAGAMAVLRAADAEATVDELQLQLQSTGVSVTDTRNGLTFPRLDLEAATSDCVSSISTTTGTATASGGSGTVDVVTDSGCAWTVSAEADWLSVDAASHTDSGAFTWTAAPNVGVARTGTLSVEGRTVTVTQDADAGPVGTVVIAGGASGTASSSVTLTLSATDADGVADMCVSNTTTCTTWVAYATTKTWTLTSGAGTKTVYVTFRDADGTASAAVSDTIVYDTTKPVNGTLTATGGNASAALSWTGFSDAGAGITSYAVYQAVGTTAPANCTTGVAAWTGTGTSATLTGLTNGTTYAWRVCAIDGAGNVSTGAIASARAATEIVPPTGTVSINGGASFTASTAATVTLSATDASGVTDACLSNTSTCTTWFPYVTSKAWTLATGTGTKTVYAAFKDANGNVSTTVSDTIVIDTTKPANGTVTASGSSGTLTLSWSGFTDANGVASYTVVYGTTSPASCTAGTLGYTGASTSTAITGLTNGTSYTARVCAVDGAGNASTGVTVTKVVAPEYNPPTGTVSIEAGAAYNNSATVDVTLAATDDTSVSTMCLSATTTCTVFVPYATTSVFTLSGTGTKTLYATFKDPYGNVSAAVSDTIVIDTAKPVNGTIGSTVAGNAQVALTWSGFTDASSGIASYTVVYQATTAPASCTVGTVGYQGSSTSATVTGLTNGTTYGFRLCGVDAAGNVSTGVTTTSKPVSDLVAPTGSVTINAGAAWTNVRTLNLTLAGVDPAGVAKMCLSTTTTCTTWVTYATTATQTPTTGDGTKTTYVKFEDTNGNQMTTAVTDTIGVDSTKPVNGTATGTAAVGSIALSWSGFTDATSGIASYTVVFQSGSSPASCSVGTVGYSGTGTSATLTGLTTGTKYYWRVCPTDVAGNVGTGVTGSATVL
ncbi:MAG: S8 family serine peptidase [Myxococcota bacterium]